MRCISLTVAVVRRPCSSCHVVWFLIIDLIVVRSLSLLITITSESTWCVVTVDLLDSVNFGTFEHIRKRKKFSMWRKTVKLWNLNSVETNPYPSVFCLFISSVNNFLVTVVWRCCLVIVSHPVCNNSRVPNSHCRIWIGETSESDNCNLCPFFDYPDGSVDRRQALAVRRQTV